MNPFVHNVGEMKNLSSDLKSSLETEDTRLESSSMDRPGTDEPDGEKELSLEEIRQDVQTSPEADLETPESGELEDRPFDDVPMDVSHCPLEGSNGTWEEGWRGNGKWVPDGEYIPGKSNPENRPFGEILAQFQIDGVRFTDGDPDFSEICKGEVKIDSFSASRADNFDQADMKMAEQRGCSPEEVSQWRRENGYTWHECRDMTTMQKVPGIVHNNISHSGGISEIRKEVSTEA